MEAKRCTSINTMFMPRKGKVFQCDAYLAKPTVISNENKKYTRITQTR